MKSLVVGPLLRVSVYRETEIAGAAAAAAVTAASIALSLAGAAVAATHRGYHLRLRRRCRRCRRPACQRPPHDIDSSPIFSYASEQFASLKCHLFGGR